MTFRDRLVGTLHAMAPVLEVPGVLVAGSEVPNLLEPDLASTLVVSQDLDLAIPVGSHGEVKASLRALTSHQPSREERSVWLPLDPRLLEVNFIGFEPGAGLRGETYVLDDPELPLLVFGTLSGLRPGVDMEVDGLRIPLPRPVDLLLEKLITDRSAVKGERDLLVALGLLVVCGDTLAEELVELVRDLHPELRHTVRSNLTVLSLLSPHANMPDPALHRARTAALLARLDTVEATS